MTYWSDPSQFPLDAIMVQNELMIAPPAIFDPGFGNFARIWMEGAIDMTRQFAKRSRGCRIFVLLLTAAGVAGAQTSQRPAQQLEETAYKISPRLQAKAQAGGMLPVFVVLARQPHPEIIARVNGTLEPRMRAAESEYYGLTSRGSASADQLQAARARLSSVMVEARQESFRQIEADIRPDQDQVEAELLGLGALDIERYSVLNMVRADIPARALPALEADRQIASVSLVEERKLQLKDSVPYLWFGAAGGQIPVGPVDYTGRGQTVAILDTGIKTSHPAFEALMAAGGIPAQAFLGHLQNPCPADLGTTEDLHGHGTHVAGIVASEGGSEILQGFDATEYKGVAPSVSLVNLKVAARTQGANGCTGGSSADDDVLAAIQWGLGLNDPRVTPITVFNYSSGRCTSDGAGGCSDEDTKTSQIFDSIADYWGVTIVVAAGNDGAKQAPDCSLTSRSVNVPGIAYNILSVANLNMKVVPPDPNLCPPPNPGIDPTSSKGPTAATAAYPIGRRKPDIAAPGTYIYSAAFDFDVAGKPQFVTMTGTSMAAPHIAGAVAVLQNRPEVHLPPSADCFLPKTAGLNTLTANTLSIKALLLNTANFAPGASGWMADSGWGWASLSTAVNQLDLAAAKGGSAIAISCVQTPLQNPPPNTLPRHYRFFKGPIQATAANAFKATVAWNRHITWGPVDQLTNPVWSQSGSPNPVVPAEPSHLRLRLYDIATNHRLDVDPPDNDPRNNVQQLVSTQSGTEVVKVYREAGFGPDQQEPFALALSQPLTPATGPVLGLGCGANVDNNTQAVTILCSVTNTGDLPLFNVAVQTAGGGACQFQVGAQTVPTLPALNPALPVSCSMPFPGNAPVTVNANGVFADEPFSATTVVVPPPPPPDCHGVSLNPAQATVGPDGGPGTFDVILPDPAKCSVRSVDVPPQLGWISVSIGNDFSGGTHIQYLVGPLNPPPPPHIPPPPPNPPRSGVIEVVLRDFTSLVFNIDQSGVVAPCTYTAAVAPAAFTYTGGPGTISITPNLAACTWTASAVEPYVLPTATNGQGTQVVPFTVGPNTKPDAATLARSVTLHVTGQNSFAQTFALTQAGLACTFALSNVPQPVSADGAPGIVVTVTPSSVDCQWTAQSAVNWIQVVGGATGKGVGPVTLAVAANAGNVRAATLTLAGQPFTITQGGAPGSGLRFVPVTPCRIADTRGAAGPYGGPALAAATPRDFNIQLSACGIPANAQAYSLNLTVVPLGPLGFLSVWPAGQSQSVVSTLNSGDGRIKANAAIVPAGVNGAITLFGSNATHVIVDINGYFVPASGAQNLAFYPITPCRLADTRGSTGAFGGPALVAATSRDFPVLSAACGIPASAQAYAFNMTVIPSGPLGFLSAWPAGSPQPGSSTLNAPTGTVTSNMAIVPAGTGGAITVIATNATHLIIDINGYFAPPGAGSLDFYTAAPCRILDTRGAAGTFGGPIMGATESRSFPVSASACGIPGTAKAYSLNATVVPPAPLGFLSLWGSGSQPTVSTLNSYDGTIVANAALVRAGTSGEVTAFTSNTSHLILDINGYFQ